MNEVTDPDILAQLNGDGPKEVTDPAILAQLEGSQNIPATVAEKPSVARAIGNIPSSFSNYVGGIAHAVRHPYDTAKTVGNLITGGVSNMLPASLQEDADAQNRAMASQVGQFYKNRYGSLSGLAEAASADPIGVLGDIATIATGGGALASKVPGLARVGEAVNAAGKAAEPVSIVLNAPDLKPVINATGRGIANTVSALGTHTGGDSIRLAYNAGAEGGPKQTALIENMRGNVAPTDVIDTAQEALAKIRADRQAAYKSGMANVGADKTQIDMSPVLEAINQKAVMGYYKGQNISPSTVETQKDIFNAVNNWKSLDPAEYHTAEGLDALKQQIGDIRDSTPEGSPSRVVANNAYHAIRQQIIAQAPAYAKTMEDYSKSSDILRQLSGSLSLGENTLDSTKLAKLQSLMKGRPANAEMLRSELEKAGAGNLTTALAGQSLSGFSPKSLSNIPLSTFRALETLAAGGATGGIGAIPMMAAQSPRIMGEAALKAGQLARLLRSGVNIPSTVTGVSNPALIQALRGAGTQQQ